MAEMNFFFNLKEREGFINYCFDNDCVIIPDSNYEDNSYYLIKNINQYHGYMKECVGFFIVSDKYKQFPLEMRSFEKDGKLNYYIRQRYGGPSVDFYTPIFAEMESNKIGPGLISIYPFYYHYNEKIIPGNELKQTYNLLISYIRKKSTKVKIGKKNYWIGINTIEQVKAGILEFVEMDGFDWATIL
ncbi:hypothetical protein BDD43_4413 [Mucilaginibacter gracilis]|uniref:Uncharacterized protein n=1 Tax=Mucilaginibacter gracilis TaxID=423350 RepID=A0A495J5C0_9SPHI|nr:hypothetical protein [Mucilaginibacter gracilis]RKR84186.1 hypothetical protein BDD43_4413 [Mucilaginibacter gracilis]